MKSLYCQKCNSREVIKNGFYDNKQRYLCKYCGYIFTTTSGDAGLFLKQVCIYLFLKGYSYREMAGILDTSHVSVYNIIAPIKDKLEKIRDDRVVQLSYLEFIEYVKNIKKQDGLYGIYIDLFKQHSIIISSD